MLEVLLHHLLVLIMFIVVINLYYCIKDKFKE